MTNGHDLGDMGIRLQPDHAAVERWHRRLGCVLAVALASGVILAALVCGAAGAIWMWR